MPDSLPTFDALLAEAIREQRDSGYVSPDRIDDWVAKLRNAAEHETGSEEDIDRRVRDSLERVFRGASGWKLDRAFPGVGRFTKANVKPRLYAELDRRILAAADLIKINRQEAIGRTLRRFRGWATSVPPGGDDGIEVRETRTAIGKDLRDYRYHRRLVDNDQGHKLVANVAALVAEDVGAIAGVWKSHGATDASYDARLEHLDRNGKTYLVRGSWADVEGLVRPINGYADEMTAPGQEVNCRCWYQYVTSLRRLPDGMLTRRGQERLAQRGLG